jgi:glycosyltransferase involved in cell wall biosynthesis
MRKIVNVYNGYLDNNGQGGGIRYLQDLIVEQSKQGYDIVVLGAGKGKKAKKYISGVEVEYIPIADTLNWIVFLSRLISHIFLYRKNYINSVFHIHRVYFAPVFCFVEQAKVVVTIHTKTFSVFESRFPKLKFVVNFFIYMERFIISKFVDEMSSSGPYAKTLYQERHFGLCNKMLDLPGRCLIESSDNVDMLFKHETKKILLCVGRISSVKRPMLVAKLFLEAVKAQPEIAQKFKLFFVGDGEQKDALRNFIKINALESNVVILGSVSSDRMPSIYKSASGLILLSESETGPYVIKESLLLGKPVFATNVGIVRDCVTEKSGCVVPVQAPELRVNEFLKFINTDYIAYDCITDVSKLLLAEETEYQENLNILYR